MDPQNQRESFGSRLGFILVSAGCAIGIGNVWRFPTVTGQCGGGIYVLFESGAIHYANGTFRTDHVWKIKF